MEKIAIITGTTKGLGKSLQSKLLADGVSIISINRNSIDIKHPLHLVNFPYDLSDHSNITDLTLRITLFLKDRKYSHLWIIHNAAIIGNIKKQSDLDIESISETIETNLITPQAINASLLANIGSEKHPLRIIHISSGAAVQAIHGMGAYCVSKAGLEMISAILAIENKDNKSFKSLCIRPGIIDTKMQSQIRSTKKEDFDQLDRFVAFKENNHLQSADIVATKIIKSLKEDKYASGDVLSIDN